MSGTVVRAAGTWTLVIMTLMVSPDAFGALNVTIAEMPEDSLSKDAVYMGSLTFAGLALFGSTLLVRAFAVTKYDSAKQNAGAMMVITGTLFMAILHVTFAFEVLSLQGPTVAWATVFTLVWTMIGGGMVVPNIKKMIKK